MGSVQGDNMWKRSLGSYNSPAIWSEDRQNNFDKMIGTNSKSKNSWRNVPNVKEILSGLVSRLRASKPRNLTLEELKKAEGTTEICDHKIRGLSV
jgi:hypothetical protein